MATNDEQKATPDERHSGAQKVYFLCFTDPVSMSAEDMRPHLEEHKNYLAELERSGKLFLAGPLLDDAFKYSGSGLIVIRADSAREARELLDLDPFHARGIRSYRLVPWQVNEGTISLQVTLSTNATSIG